MAAEVIKTNIAIEFFNVIDLIGKYDSKYNNSLPPRLRNPDRQEIYKTLNQSEYYSNWMVPLLDSLRIPIVKKSYTDSFLTFEVAGVGYTIALDNFKEQDGVIFYKAGNKPVLWNIDKMTDRCYRADMVREYFRIQ